MSKFQPGDKVIFKGNYKNTSSTTQQLDKNKPMTVLSVYPSFFEEIYMYVVSEKDSKVVLEEQMLELYVPVESEAGRKAISVLEQIAEYMMDYQYSEAFSDEQLIELINKQILHYFKQYPHNSDDTPNTLQEKVTDLTQNDFPLTTQPLADSGRITAGVINADVFLHSMDTHIDERSSS